MIVNFRSLWENHHPEWKLSKPCSTNGVPNHANQCAVCMGECLSLSGVSLESFRGVRCWSSHQGQAKHILRAEELARWMSSKPQYFGEVERHKGQSWFTFSTRTGIVFFKDFWGPGNTGDHIDVWNKTEMRNGKLEYFTRAKEVWFWPIN